MTQSISPNDIQLSLCMIVKNEEQNLSSCLESVKDIVDEMIILDTGSNDNTVNSFQPSGVGQKYLKLIWAENLMYL